MAKLKYNYNKVIFSKRNNILRDNGFNTYKDYLESDYWKTLKSRVKSDYWKTCNVCGITVNVQIHHTNYKDKNLFKGNLNDLLPACGDCHNKIHELSREKNISFKMAARKLRRKNKFVYKQTKVNKRSKTIIIGKGNHCPSCKKPMNRKKHVETPQKFHYTEWDVCFDCKHVQHYEEFKSSDWVEAERQQSFFNSLRK